MNFHNTTQEHNTILKNPSNYGTVVFFDIIRDFDEQITYWKKAASEWGCDNPDELINKINSLPENY